MTNVYFFKKIDVGWGFGPLAPSPIYTTVFTPCMDLIILLVKFT